MSTTFGDNHPNPIESKNLKQTNHLSHYTLAHLSGFNDEANLNMGWRTCLCYQCAIKQWFFLDGRQPLCENAENTTVVDGFLVARLVGNQSSVLSEMCFVPWFNGKNCGKCWLLQFRHSFHEVTHWTQNVCFQLFSLVCTNVATIHHLCMSTRGFFRHMEHTPPHPCLRPTPLHHKLLLGKRKCILLAEFPGSSFLTKPEVISSKLGSKFKAGIVFFTAPYDMYNIRFTETKKTC